MSPEDISDRIRRLGRGVGFDLVGIAPVRPSQRAAYYRDWLARGHHGQMAYLARNQGLRTDPAGLLPNAQSIVCVALSYQRQTPTRTADSASDSTTAVHGPTGRVARYAQGADYHRLLREMLERLESEMRREIPTPFEARPFVDTGPLLEREIAAAAGIGWIGKNTLLLHRKLGSYLLLGELMTTLAAATHEIETDHCGTCTRCLDACPTQAFPAPYQMDASRCISYLTIEQRGEWSAAAGRAIGDWVYGCDICQEVCPHNAHAPAGTHAELCAARLPARLPLIPLTQLRAGDYRRMTRDSATSRATQAMWKRNAAQALRNAEAAPQEPTQFR